jgi:Na+-translocating ferredoxin:NAD+ oxidoreductase RnfD subunit
VSIKEARKHRRPSTALRKFFRSPKGLLTIVLTILLVPASLEKGVDQVAPGLSVAVIFGALIDAPILRFRGKAWEFPSGAVLTAMLVAMVLSPEAPWYVPGVTTTFAIVSKYLFRTRSANIFNPAALALIASFHLFGTGQSWWGALPETNVLAPVALGATGVFITDRVNKMPLVLAFLGTYYLLFTATAYLGDPAAVAEIFRTPDVEAALFFAFFMLTDPPTSPVKYRPQVICGVMVAAASYVFFEWVGAVYYLLAGVIVGNVWEAWRRAHPRKRPLTIAAAST